MQKILMIGSGRLAQHLTYWNSLLENPNLIQNWNRKKNTTKELEQYLIEASLIWLAISDSAIIQFYLDYLSKYKKPVVHFSGAPEGAAT